MHACALRGLGRREQPALGSCGVALDVKKRAQPRRELAQSVVIERGWE
jgi:hypothetical protein